MAENNLVAMIMLSAINYALWKPKIKDILFYKNLYGPLENKGDKSRVTNDEKWKKMN